MIKVLVEKPDRITAHRVRKVKPYLEGYAFEYKDERVWDYVYVPADWILQELNGFKVVGKLYGNNSACRIISSSCDENCPGEDLSTLVRTHVMSTGYQRVYERKLDIVKLAIVLGVVAVVIIAGVIIYRQFIYPNIEQSKQPASIEQTVPEGYPKVGSKDGS